MTLVDLKKKKKKKTEKKQKTFFFFYVLVDGENVCKDSERGEVWRSLHGFWPPGVAVLLSDPLPVPLLHMFMSLINLLQTSKTVAAEDSDSASLQPKRTT